MAHCQYPKPMESSKSQRAPQSADKYVLRLPDGMRDKLADLARANNRSMNAEMVHILQQAIDGVTPRTNAPGDGEEKELLAAILQKLSEKTYPVEVDLWDTEHIAAYLKRSYTTVRDKIIVRPDFPKPIKINPTQERSHPLFKAREVISWAESLQS